MIKLFIKHWIFEKCIDVLFDGIIKAFNKPREILGFKKEKKGDRLIATLTRNYKDKIYTVTQIISDSDIYNLMKLHKLTEAEIHSILKAGLMMDIDIQIKLEELESPDTIIAD